MSINIEYNVTVAGNQVDLVLDVNKLIEVQSCAVNVSAVACDTETSTV